MKKLLLIAGILSILVVFGCQQAQVTKSDDAFTDKEKCAKYIDLAKKKEEELKMDFIKSWDVSYDGTYYSPVLNTCVSLMVKYKKPDNDANVNDIQYDYYDTLTSDDLIGRLDEFQKDDFEKLIKLIK